MTTSPTMPTSLILPVIERFSLKVKTEREFLNKLDTNRRGLRGDGDTGTGFSAGLSRALPSTDFAAFEARFNDVCVVSLGRAFQGGLWPAITQLWIQPGRIDGINFAAAFEVAAAQARHEYYPPVEHGTVLEAFAAVGGIVPTGDDLLPVLAEARRRVEQLAVRYQDPGIYTVKYLLEAFDEIWQ